ncbi:broad specificity phosphatase PhoE [Symbiobacterium terraclitae]|uniref:Broad specificity phosphatase PhoE n=1 Tax=Symbiobacterium terraclitae TaxID=557451 RepID=A0ABS4JSC1_9FIRM|nr:broad specificity phosphatase PhoE [Symbiobacterium terraclitae]
MRFTLYLVRHGETAANAEGRYIGWGEHPLSRAGEAQARLAARYLSRCPVTCIRTSDLQRCLQTAGRIGEATGLTPVPDPRLRELDFGRFSGLTHHEIARRWPGELAAWMADPERASPPGGESVSSLRRRALAALPRRDGAVVVTHGGVIRTLLAHLTGTGLWDWQVPPGGVVTVQWDGARSLGKPAIWRPGG